MSAGYACSHAGVGVVPVVFAVSSCCFALVDVIVCFEKYPWAPRTRTCGAGRFWLLLLLPRDARLALLGAAVAVCGFREGGGRGAA